VVARTTKSDAASAKAETAEESTDDIYDTNLTQAEVQKQINLANAAVAAEQKHAELIGCLGSVATAATAGDDEALWAALCSGPLGITEAEKENVADYRAAIAASVAGGEQLTVGSVQDAVDESNVVVAARNAEVARLASKSYAIAQINSAIESADPDAIVAALQAAAAAIENVDATCGMEYLVQLSEKKAGKAGALEQEDIQGAVSEANVLVDEQRRVESVLSAVNGLLYGEEGDAEATLALMKDNRELLELPELWDAAPRFVPSSHGLSRHMLG
jgi:hypothetical protein